MKKVENNKENNDRIAIYNTTGITLIALVITIIVLLILAGVSIATLTGDNGILTQSIKAKETTKIASEKEAIDLEIVEFNMNNKLNNSNISILGIPLYDKTIANGSIWEIVFDKSDNTTYGTGWNYIQKDTEIKNFGKLNYNWVVNYETGKSKQLEDNNYTKLSYQDNIATTDGLIFNIDPSIISNSDKETIEKELGENVELKNFNWNEESGLTKNSFNFDGVDDYITMKYDNQIEKDKLAENGFTFEFYGVINQGDSYNNGKPEDSNYNGIFCYWNGIEDKQADFRFGITEELENKMRWNAGYEKVNSDYSDLGSPWNIQYSLEDWKYGEEIFFTITVDTSKSYIKDGVEYYTHTLYMNGDKLYQGGYNKYVWEGFLRNNLNNLNKFCIGRSSMHVDGFWHYAKLNTYTLRLYNRALTNEEVTNNYNTSVAYHNMQTGQQ